MPIVQYWDTGDPPGYIAELFATFRACNPGMQHRLFDESQAAELIAAHFGEREVNAFNACAVPAMQADYFRYCAVFALGGVYADAGYRCISPLHSLLEGDAGGVLFRRDPPGYLFNGFFLFTTPGHPLLRLTLDVATANIERRAAEMVQMVTGPWIFTALSALFRLGSSEPLRQSVAEHGLGGLIGPFRREVEVAAPTARGRRGIEPMLEPLFDTIGDFARVEEAFEGVRVAPFEEMTELVREPERRLPYKREMNWIRWQRSGRTIFR